MAGFTKVAVFHAQVVRRKAGSIQATDAAYEAWFRDWRDLCEWLENLKPSVTHSLTISIKSTQIQYEDR